MKRPYIPAGCDQQGRRPDRAPAPAEASSDLLGDDDLAGRRITPAECAAHRLIGGVVLLILLIASASFVVRVLHSPAAPASVSCPLT